ncbi:hypothetical protein RRG08_067201 [Elysia crispata]|uniref:Uncharacterized protein n=1 Tax=Elysia crispata TaxID=231223 RepID=A0AAE1CVL4_9GAST|nr:hypothetical protein RRG08_067201 [Elysia crispata]
MRQARTDCPHCMDHKMKTELTNLETKVQLSLSAAGMDGRRTAVEICTASDRGRQPLDHGAPRPEHTQGCVSSRESPDSHQRVEALGNYAVPGTIKDHSVAKSSAFRHRKPGWAMTFVTSAETVLLIGRVSSA